MQDAQVAITAWIAFPDGSDNPLCHLTAPTQPQVDDTNFNTNNLCHQLPSIRNRCLQNHIAHYTNPSTLPMCHPPDLTLGQLHAAALPILTIDATTISATAGCCSCCSAAHAVAHIVVVVKAGRWRYTCFLVGNREFVPGRQIGKLIMRLKRGLSVGAGVKGPLDLVIPPYGYTATSEHTAENGIEAYSILWVKLYSHFIIHPLYSPLSQLLPQPPAVDALLMLHPEPTSYPNATHESI